MNLLTFVAEEKKLLNGKLSYLAYERKLLSFKEYVLNQYKVWKNSIVFFADMLRLMASLAI